MRIWSLSPALLDQKGLTALWRETLLARKVLRGETKGYTRHPQLIRFREHDAPLLAIDFYLQAVQFEASKRGYNFDASKFQPVANIAPIAVTTGQIDYEWQHLLNKLKVRDPARADQLMLSQDKSLHPLFYAVDGPIAEWEVVSHT